MHVETRQLILVGSLLGWMCIGACGGSTTHIESGRETLRNGDPNGPPTIQSLPDVARASASPRVQSGLTLARQILATRFPEPPADRSYRQLQSWIDEHVVPWVSARRDSVDETRSEFGLEHGASEDERIVATAVIGLLQEDTALSLANIPAPAELDTEPEIGQMFRELVRTQTQPFQTAALTEYRDCANRAYGQGQEQRRWALFCHGRFDHLEAKLHASR